MPTNEATGTSKESNNRTPSSASSLQRYGLFATQLLFASLCVAASSLDQVADSHSLKM